MAKKKAGQHAVYCKYYKATNRREKNKKIKLLKHLKKHPEDVSGQKSLESLKNF